MTSAELSQYLANVISVIRADGTLTPAEELAFASIVAEAGAKKKDAKEADKLASQPDFQPKPVGRYSDHIRNIEDMIFVALADGGLDAAEKSLIVAFAKQTGLNQDQITKIVAEAQARARSQTSTLICPKCASQCQAAAKFCPECGTPIEPAVASAGTRLEFEYPATGISIEFAESTAATFDSALREAKRNPHFQEIDRNRKKWFLASWPAGSISDAFELAKDLKGVRNRKIHIDGKEVPWDEVFGFLSCAEQRACAYQPTQYCFGADEKRPNLWGCKQFRMDWGEWADWFSYGKYVARDVFEFDKNRIIHDIRTNLHELRFCPFIRAKLIQAVVRLFPDQSEYPNATGGSTRRTTNRHPIASRSR